MIETGVLGSVYTDVCSAWAALKAFRVLVRKDAVVEFCTG